MNEPHYLSKAKHYWDPEWCRGDFFLESSNPHQVFYQTVGLMTNWFSLETTAVMGRLAGYLLLAFGWESFFRQVTGSSWKSIPIAWLFLGITTIQNLSGEWIIGGIESKVFCYGFLFLALSASLRSKNKLMMIWHGLAISFHPVVGVWGLLANLGAKLFCELFRKDHSLSNNLKKLIRHVPSYILPVILLVLFSLPGLIPAFELLGASHEGVSVNEANYIQVIYRLGHHLDPTRFPPRAWGYYAVLLAVSILLVRFLYGKDSQQEQYQYLFWFVLTASLFALGGTLVGWRTGSAWDMPFYSVRLKLLKFYPFRLADVFIPILFATCLVQLFSRFQIRRNLFIWGISLLMLGIAFINPPLNANPSRYSRQKLDDWMEVCDWFQANTDEEILVFTPKESWAFKWYAERPEFVTMKDCPQEPKGLVEWNNRLLYLSHWGEDHFDEGFSSEALSILKEEKGITHLVTSRLGPIHQKPVFENKWFRVYEIE